MFGLVENEKNKNKLSVIKTFDKDTVAFQKYHDNKKINKQVHLFQQKNETN
jgi:hypothetical protein